MRIQTTVLTDSAKVLLATLVFFLSIEALLRFVYFVRNRFADYVPLPYSIEDEYGPTPPWLDGLRIIERDRALIWKLRSGLKRKYVDLFSPVPNEEVRRQLLRQFVPRLPDYLKDNPSWEISLNSRGFRDREFSTAKPPGAFRIVCLGDSWTFGANVGQDQNYPRQLQGLLQRAYPNRKIEVLNLGVLGYSSFQGRELLRRIALSLDPDVVIIAYALNDASPAGFHDSDMSGFNTSPAEKLGAWLSAHAESYKLLRYFLAIMTYRPPSFADKLRKTAETAAMANEPEEPEKLKPWLRVPLKDYEANITEMISLARSRGVGVILLYNELIRTRYRTALEEIAHAQRVPFVDGNALVSAAKKEIEKEVEAKLALEPAHGIGGTSAGEVEVLFRVYAGNRAVPKALYISGNHPKLGDLVPNKVALYDDGTHGDERAGDRVWSLSARFPPGTKLFYVYTNSGRESRWEGLDAPAIRSLTVENARESVRPVESFGRLYMHADNWHTNAAGYQLIARALFDVLKQDDRLNNR